MSQSRVVKNAAWIIACKIVQAILGVIVTMLSARFLGPSGYGIINYAASVVAFVAPVMQLGLNSTLVQEFIHAPEKEGETLGTALVMSLCSSILCIIGVIAFSMVANHGEKVTVLVCALYSLLLVFQALEISQYWYQAKLKSKYTSIVMLLAYVLISAYRIILLASGGSIYLFAVSQAIDYMLISVALLVIYNKLGGQKLAFSFASAKRMFAKSKYYIIPNLMVSIFANTDKVMLQLMLGEETTGFYSAALGSITMTGFVYSAIIDSARPSIFESQKISENSFEKNVIRLYSVIIYLSLLQSLLMTIFAPLIIKILYGSQYGPSVNVLRLAVWYTTFAYIGSVRNIWILAKNKQKYLWILNLSGALMNVVLNFVLIPVLGMSGAALASLITQIFTNVTMNHIIKPIRHNNVLMARSLNPKYLKEMIKK